MKPLTGIKFLVALLLCTATVQALADQTPKTRGDQSVIKNKTYNRRPTPAGAIAHFDLEYAEVAGESLKLDLYLPKKTDKKPPLILWIHGGSWRSGDKVQVNYAIIKLGADGYAVASINYRFGDIIMHPNQIHDCKGALRWLRANAEKYGYDPARVAVGGGSAGGHLALLLGLSGGVADLEGTTGGNPEFAGPVQAILDFYGPSDMVLMAKNSNQFKHTHEYDQERLPHASPITYLDPTDPPVLIFHGNQDKTAPIEQSLLLHERYQKAGLVSELHILEGVGHGGPVFSDDERYQLIKAFLDKHL